MVLGEGKAAWGCSGGSLRGRPQGHQLCWGATPHSLVYTQPSKPGSSKSRGRDHGFITPVEKPPSNLLPISYCTPPAPSRLVPCQPGSPAPGLALA